MNKLFIIVLAAVLLGGCDFVIEYHRAYEFERMKKQGFIRSAAEVYPYPVTTFYDANPPLRAGERRR